MVPTPIAGNAYAIPLQPSVLSGGTYSNNCHFMKRRASSKKFKAFALKRCGVNAHQTLFNELSTREEHDGVWACSSGLHLPKEKLNVVIAQMTQALRHGGVMYLPFNYGSFEGKRRDRYFIDFTKQSFLELLATTGCQDELGCGKIPVDTTQRHSSGCVAHIPTVSLMAMIRALANLSFLPRLPHSKTRVTSTSAGLRWTALTTSLSTSSIMLSRSNIDALWITSIPNSCSASPPHQSRWMAETSTHLERGRYTEKDLNEAYLGNAARTSLSL